LCSFWFMLFLVCALFVSFSFWFVLSMDWIHLRGAIGGKTGKTAVLS
jgi:hypothetical protein